MSWRKRKKKVANTRLRSPGVYLENIEPERISLLPHQVKWLLGRKDLLVTDAMRESEWLSNAKIEICAQCKVALLCYARRPLLGYWCEHCVGFYLFDLDILVQCTEFQSVAKSRDSIRRIKEQLEHNAYKYGHSHELICCTKRRRGDIEVFGGMIVRHEP